VKKLRKAGKIAALGLAFALLAMPSVSGPASADTAVLYGDADGNGVINSADVTMLRAYIAQGRPSGFPGINRTNADVDGNGTIDINDVSRLRAYLAAPDPASVRLGPRYFISITTDDGPHETHTLTMLNHLRNLNARENVVCGQNGTEPCRSGTGCGTVCGTQSRAHISFYVMGGEVTGHWTFTEPADFSRVLMRRMLEEGHSIENHTWSHLIAHTHGREHIVTEEIARTNDVIRRAVHGQGPVTDLYGNTWSDSNPYPIFSFRPNNFTMGAAFRHADTDTGQPWIFAGLDVDDWRGHTATQMLEWILNGSRPLAQRPCNCSAACNFSSTWNDYAGVNNNVSAANGGVVLIHDNNSAKNGYPAHAGAWLPLCHYRANVYIHGRRMGVAGRCCQPQAGRGLRYAGQRLGDTRRAQGRPGPKAAHQTVNKH
jgi:peptidoglycan/xylan/chitin deacetylase (PgdA/CDA1 family)